MRHLLIAASLCIGLLSMVTGAVAAYPDRQVRLIVSLAPGGSVDTVARVIAAKLAESWKQPVVVDNRPGADGTVAEQRAAAAAPDGYTLLFVSGEHDANPVLYGKLPYDPVGSFIPVIRATNTPVVLVVDPARVPVKTMAGLIEFARANPGKLNYGHGGLGTPPNLAMLLLMKETGIDITPVQFKGMAPALVSLLGGEIQMMLGTVTVVAPYVAGGKLTPLAVSTGARIHSLPDVPTVAEAANLPGFDVGSWTGIFAPAKTPDAVVQKVNADVQAVLAMPDVQKILTDQDFQIIGGSPEDFGKFVMTDMARWKSTFPSRDRATGAVR